MRISKAASEIVSKEVKNKASDVYSNDNVVVTSSVFSNTKSSVPKAKAVDIGDLLQFPKFE